MNCLPLLYSNLEDRIGYHFKNKGLLIQAFTHSSIKSILHTIIDENSV
jgi:dsRNA-specific ribonuclease